MRCQGRCGGLVLAWALVACGSGEAAPSQASEVRLCDVPETRAHTVRTSRAGEVSYCSDAWVEATSSPPCIAEGDCQASGLQCVKKPGNLVYECRRPCGGGLVCPEGEVCRQCEDSSPHCAPSSACPEPWFPQVNGRGESCAWVTDCVTTDDCCSDRRGNPGVCIQKTSHFTTIENTVTTSCSSACKTASDCPENWCCMSFDRADDEYYTSIVVDAPATSTCWAPDIYDFCTSPAGSSTSSGGTECDYSGCLSACVEAGGTNCGDTCRCD